MSDLIRTGLFRKVDAVQIRVPDLDAGLAFYGDKLGHELRWRSDTAAGLGMPESGTEIVLHTEIGPETDLLVASVEQAVDVFAQEGLQHGFLCSVARELRIVQHASAEGQERLPMLADERGKSVAVPIACRQD